MDNVSFGLTAVACSLELHTYFVNITEPSPLEIYSIYAVVPLPIVQIES